MNGTTKNVLAPVIKFAEAFHTLFLRRTDELVRVGFVILPKDEAKLARIQQRFVLRNFAPAGVVCPELP